MHQKNRDSKNLLQGKNNLRENQINDAIAMVMDDKKELNLKTHHAF